MSRRVEFIGDSTSSGACNMDTHANGEGPRGSYAFSWPKLLCEQLGAECHSLQKAGYGVHSNMWVDDTYQRPDGSLPQLWEHAVTTDPSHQWDFSKWVPHAIVMSMAGTN